MSNAARFFFVTAALVVACRLALPPVPQWPLVVIPFDPYGGAIYVPSVINGDSAWLMFDTGLSRSGLDREWAQTIGAVGAMPPGALTPQVAETVSTVVLDTLRLGEVVLRHARVALYPLAGLSEASGRPERGLLGHDVLQRFAIEIDYRARRVRLFDAAQYSYAGSGTAVPFAAGATLPLVEARVKVRGRPPIPARLLLDTGASGLCLILTTPFVEQHGLVQVSPALEAPIGTGLAGELHGTIARLQELRLGGVRVASPTTGLGGENKGFLGRTDIDGVIGNAVFEGSRLIVDYARRRVIVERPAAPDSRCDFDMSGLRLIARGADLRQIIVDYVVPRSPGAEAGITVGDELLLVDGRRVGDADLFALRKAFRVEGATRALVLRRGGDTIRVAIRLRHLL
ncbi:MAG TPA: aspartyl protease family protein [Gemmatimonadales bacterium]|nr:aspartyl protease family protein [Gemmatimonadales bacterium]